MTPMPLFAMEAMLPSMNLEINPWWLNAWYRSVPKPQAWEHMQLLGQLWCLQSIKNNLLPICTIYKSSRNSALLLLNCESMFYFATLQNADPLSEEENWKKVWHFL